MVKLREIMRSRSVGACHGYKARQIYMIILFYYINPSCCPLLPPYYPITRWNSIPGVIYGVLLWADINAATPLGAWGAL